jgi:[glutamine synthetase] adenylyltransferase / [glutamine synthetase]-adenylyl-L-tyrosine phosphorylase
MRGLAVVSIETLRRCRYHRAVMSPELLGRALGDAPNPELARVAVSRLEERPGARELLERPEVFPAAARLLGFSTAAADFFVAHPEELASLGDVRLRSAAELEGEAAAAVEALGSKPGLRRFRRRASYRVAARDLGGGYVVEVMEELSAIAEACLSAGLRAVDGGDLAVIAMGKLGGRELNYSSDVDVLFVHGRTGAEEQAGAVKAASALIDLLSEATADGLALRVDPNLRPEGRAGPLSRSLDSMLEYYERHAETWERQALLKARPAAGDLELGRAFVDGVGPFVYPESLAPTAIDDVRATKVRIEEHVRARGKEAVELKRGWGGIRDVEFAVQLLQLVHGRRHPSLRRTGTLPTLAQMAEEGFVAKSDAEALADSYRFLRRLEHRLQMARDLQTHELPTDRAALGPLARSMALFDAAALLAEHQRHTSTVRGLHERLFYRPLMEAFAGPTAPSPGVDRTATEELLGGLGFRDPRSAYESLARVVEPSTRLGKVLAGLFPVIAPQLAFAAVPDRALVRFERAVDGLRHDEALAEALLDRPDAARRLAALVALSSVFSDALVAQPSLVRALFELPAPERPLFPVSQDAELLRVAGGYASRELEVPEVGRRLATVADQAFAVALAAEAPPVPMAVIGMGKLGGEELSFASDLDVMFVYEGEGRGDFEMANRAAERILRAVREAGWEADADLRPEGRSGPLVRSMASYLEYWERWAETWEFQALLRARFVAGDELLGRRFVSNATDFAYPESLTFEQVAAIRRMRVRIEEERVRPAEARRFHFKLGYGSLADVQFAVELSLMRDGFAQPSVRRTNTLEALETLAAHRLLEDSVAVSLGDAYTFLTDIKCMLELERRVRAEALPSTPEAISSLGRALGYEERARHLLLQDYRRITHKARLAMERVFYGEDA